MRLSDEERAMVAGELGEVRRWAIAHQIAVGEFFDAADFVPVSQAHIMADTEFSWRGWGALSRNAGGGARGRAAGAGAGDHRPAGLDFAVYRRLGADAGDGGAGAVGDRGSARLRRADDGYLHQLPDDHRAGPRRAYGVWRDRGRHLFEQRLWRTQQFRMRAVRVGRRAEGSDPRYGYHLDACRRATRRFRFTAAPRDLSEWGALGGIVGEACGSYWEVPVVEGIETVPGSDALKHFGTALASFGSVALFRPSSPSRGLRQLRSAMPRSRCFSPATPRPTTNSTSSCLARRNCHCSRWRRWPPPSTGIGCIPTRRSSSRPRPRFKHAADRMGLTRRIEAAGAIVAQGICFYQSYAREMAEANGWGRLMTNSAKLVNIIGGYGYRPTLASLERCVDSAIAGRVR